MVFAAKLAALIIVQLSSYANFLAWLQHACAAIVKLGAWRQGLCACALLHCNVWIFCLCPVAWCSVSHVSRDFFAIDITCRRSPVVKFFEHAVPAGCHPPTDHFCALPLASAFSCHLQMDTQSQQSKRLRPQGPHQPPLRSQAPSEQPSALGAAQAASQDAQEAELEEREESTSLLAVSCWGSRVGLAFYSDGEASRGRQSLLCATAGPAAAGQPRALPTPCAAAPSDAGPPTTAPPPAPAATMHGDPG